MGGVDMTSPVPSGEAARRRNHMTPARAQVILEALRNGETVARSAALAALSQHTACRYRQRDQAFAELMQDAQRSGLQARARRRERKRAPFRAMRYRLVQGTEPYSKPQAHEGA
ncbi:hypothetical protein GCM10009730_51300 [Streptomyces albidochromogenes]